MSLSFFLNQSASSSSCIVHDSISSNICEVLLINASVMFVFENFIIHHRDWLTYSGGTERTGELCCNFPQMSLLRWLISPLVSLTVTLSLVLQDLFLSSSPSTSSTITFPPLGYSDHAVVSVSIDFPINSKYDVPFHGIVNDYSCVDCDSLCDNLRDVPWQCIFQLSASTADSEFGSGFRLESIYISLIVSIRSNLTHSHGFQLLVLLPKFIEITFFVCTNRKNLLNLE